jgi:hypothetical protein
VLQRTLRAESQKVSVASGTGSGVVAQPESASAAIVKVP